MIFLGTKHAVQFESWQPPDCKTSKSWLFLSFSNIQPGSGKGILWPGTSRVEFVETLCTAPFSIILAAAIEDAMMAPAHRRCCHFYKAGVVHNIMQLASGCNLSRFTRAVL